MTNPRLSVIVTCYNYGKYLDSCLTSILNQTYRDFELIIVNDGSTDTTDEVISRYLENEKIRYVKQTNTGQAIATNNGIKTSRGALVAFLDADDLWESTKLEKQVCLFTEDSIGVVYSRIKFMNEDGIPIDMELKGKYYTPRSGYVTEALLFENFVPYSSTIVRKECFDKFGLFNPEYKNGLDWDMWLRISREYQFAFVDEHLLIYRIGHPEQLTSNAERSVNCSDLILDRFIDSNPGLVPKRVIRKAKAYSYCRRGNMLRKTDRQRATTFFRNALSNNPIELDAYIGLLKNTLRM
jgi:glycosyltransferase involved in cell wall biosynthesis